MAGLLLGCVAVALVVCVVYAFVVEPRLREVRFEEKPPTGDPALRATPFVWRGLDRPPAVSAAEARVAPDAEVIGVVAGGKARAYLVDALRGPTHHVVNDVLGEAPVSVTFCDRNECVRAFTGPEPGQPLPLNLGGWDGANMLLQSDGRFYLQHTGRAYYSTSPGDALPFDTLPAERTTWKAWHAAHPDTDVFVGEAPAPSP
jgi:hypothetical protein